MRRGSSLDLPRYLRYFPAARKGLLAARLDQDSRRHAPFQEGPLRHRPSVRRVLRPAHRRGVPRDRPALADLAEVEARLNAIIKFEAVLAKAHVYVPALTEYRPKLLGA